MVSGLVAGRLAVVTGAGSGIGRAACAVLSREGAVVVAADRLLAAAQDTIRAHTALALAPDRTNDSADHIAVECDVSSVASVSSLLQTSLQTYGTPPTVVVNCAGITRDNWLLKLSDDDYDSVMNVNLKGTFLVMRAFARAMTEASLRGSIVNISSIVGKYGNMGQTNYAGSKAGVVGMTRAAAQELGKYNIRVNAILPGMIQTPIIRTVPEQVLRGMLKRVPLGRVGEPLEVAEVIAFLASDKSSYITGAAVDVSGGY